MLPQRFSLLRPAVLTTAVLLLGRSVYAQAPAPTDNAGTYQRPGLPAPGIYGADGRQQRTSTGRRSSTPVMTPGYFEMVCPAVCYGGAFHVCGKRAFGGPGYYGPFRRYWAYSTYGPNFNIGPDNSIQFGLQSGVMYEAMRACKGLRKYGADPCAYSGAVPAVQTSNTPLVGEVGGNAAAPPAAPPIPPRNGGEKGGQPAEKMPPPTGYTAHLRLVVPENADVLVEGSKTTATGTIRDFVSPPLQPGKNMIYSVLVRYTDAGGKTIEETHSVRIRANDRLHIDCTKPANVEQPRTTAAAP